MIAASGLLVSEYLPGTPVIKGSFVQRNRLIAAFSDVLIIVQASIDSGTMATAPAAKDLGVPILCYHSKDMSKHYFSGIRELFNSKLAQPISNSEDIEKSFRLLKNVEPQKTDNNAELPLF